MRLLRLKLFNSFRSLPAGFEVSFGSEQRGVGISPICFVGVNGSGKSNLLELLSEVFFYCEHLVKRAQGVEVSSSPIGSIFMTLEFMLEYVPDQQTINRVLANFQKAEDAKTNGRTYIVQVIKRGNEKLFVDLVEHAPSVKRHFLVSLDEFMLDLVLPNKVIGYSSGGNELLSNPYVRMELGNFELYRKSTASGLGGNTAEQDDSRFFFMDYGSNKLIAVCNYIFGSRSKKQAKDRIRHLNEVIGVEDMHSFSISLRPRGAGGARIELPSSVNLDIERLRQCATCYCVEDNGRERLDFRVSDQTRKAFSKKFGNALRLYRALNGIRSQNAELLGIEKRRSLMTGDEPSDLWNMSQRTDRDDAIFSVDEVVFRKSDPNVLVSYHELSDGEHQLMHVLGTIILMAMPGALFLLDEPETHFNPEWRAKFVSLLNKCIGQDEEGGVFREQEIILTTHSPFVVSDCQQDRVFLFKRKGANLAEVECRAPDFNTFGASVDLITAKLFDYELSFGEKANEKLDELKTELEKLKADLEHNRSEAQALINRAYDELGESAERVFFIKEVMDQRDSPDSA